MRHTWKQIISIVAGGISAFFQLYALIIGMVCMAIVFDMVTGVCAAKATGTKISSKVARQGFWKKVGLMLALFFGMFLDIFIPTALTVIHVELPFNTPFGLIFGCYIVFNESISICENFDKINPTILPKWVKFLIQGGASKIDTQVNHNEEELDNERERD